MKYNIRTREVILKASIDIFLKNGFYKTTSRAIASAAEVNVALINYYFESKLNLAKEAHEIVLTDIYNKIDLSEYEYKNSIEKLYLSYLLVQEKANLLDGFLEFHIQLLSKGDFFQQSSIPSCSNPLIEEIIAEENIVISDFNKKIFQAMRSGSEFALLKGKVSGELELDYLKLNEFLLLNITSYLGIDKEKTMLCVTSVNNKLSPSLLEILTK